MPRYKSLIKFELSLAHTHTHSDILEIYMQSVKFEAKLMSAN